MPEINQATNLVTAKSYRLLGFSLWLFLASHGGELKIGTIFTWDNTALLVSTCQMKVLSHEISKFNVRLSNESL